MVLEHDSFPRFGVLPRVRQEALRARLGRNRVGVDLNPRRLVLVTPSNGGYHHELGI